MSDVLCAICQTPIDPDSGTPVRRCDTCDTPYHAECWEEIGGCAQYGCASMHAVGVLDEMVGADTACPSCGRTIKTTALRCRWCGAVFHLTTVTANVAPVATDVVALPAAPKPPGLLQDRSTKVTLLLFAAIFPLTAPIALLAAAWSLLKSRKSPMPTRFRALTVAALVIAGCISGGAIFLVQQAPGASILAAPGDDEWEDEDDWDDGGDDEDTEIDEDEPTPDAPQ